MESMKIKNIMAEILKIQPVPPQDISHIKDNWEFTFKILAS